MNFKLLITAMLFTSHSFAAKSLTTKIHNQYNSFRALGMGNAFTAVADDYSLIFYNPAGFARKKNNEIQLSLVGVGFSPKTADFAKEVSDAEKSATNDTDKANAISAVLDKYYGETMGGRLQAVELFWIRKNWGIALLPLDLTLDMTIDKQLGPSVDLNVIKDTSFAFGYGDEYSKTLSWGVTAKAIHRLEVEERLIALDLATNPDLISEDRAKEGFTADLDVGIMYNPEWFSKIQKRRPTAEEVKQIRLTAKEKAAKAKAEAAKIEAAKVDEPEITIDMVAPSVSGVATVSGAAVASSPVVLKNEPKTEPKAEEKEEYVTEEKYPLTLALVARNVLGGKFSQQKIINDKATLTPDNLERVIDVGSQYEFAQFGEGDLTLRAMLDFKNILHPEINVNKATHFGVEFDYSPSGWFKAQFRAGMNQMYYTAGATLLLGIFNIEAATYGEEVGTSSNKIENRVYAAKIGMNF